MNEEPATEKQVKFMRNLNIDVPNGITKMEARIAIDRVLKKGEEDDMQKPEVVKPGEIGDGMLKARKNGQASMYASYAKDIFCVLRDNKIIGTDQIAQIPEMNKNLMVEAIELVKQAKEAFE